MSVIYDLKASDFADGAITLPSGWSTPRPAGLTWDVDDFIKSSGLIFNPVSAGDSNGLLLVNGTTPTLPVDKTITYFMGLQTSITSTAIRHAFLFSADSSAANYYLLDFRREGDATAVRLYRMISGAATFPIPYDSTTCPAIATASSYNVKLQVTYSVSSTSFALSVNDALIAAGSDSDSRFMGVGRGGVRLASGQGVSYLAASDDSAATYPFSTPTPDPITSIFWERFDGCTETA